MSILDTLITKQSYLYKLLNSTIDNIKALDKAEVTRGYLETRVKILENTWVKFQSNQEKILSTRLSDSALKLPYFSDNTFEQGQETYASTKGKLITMLDKFEHSESIPGSKFIEASGSDSRRTPSLFQRSLPRIQLPSFSGDYKAWKSFHDLFSSMIGNNPDLSPIEKFHYLKLSVEGEAEQLLSNIMVSSENFVRAWDILVNRYENKRLLLKTHLDRLFNNFAVPSPAVVSVGTVNALTSTFHAADPHHVVKHPNALLGTARVRLYSPNGHQLNVRTLIDPGSQISIISERAVQKLRLKRRHASLPLSGVGAVNAGTTKGIVSFVLKPYFDSKLEWDVNAYILPKPTAELPAVTLTCEWQHLKEITLADPDFLKSGSIDLIIGIELYSQIIEAELMKGPRGSPFARRTGLGWVIFGPVGGIEDAEITLQNSTSNHLSLQSLQCSVNYDLYEALQRFWVQEEIQKDTEKTLTSEEAECENHFLDTHRRDINGRYIVRLPFKETPERLGNSRGAAAHMLNKTLKRLSSDNNMKNLYTNFLLEYESLGHMVQVNDYTLTAKGYYLPHHGVLKESSSSTKLRVVFNGSCRTDKGTSLNDILYTGAKLQTDLTDVITWWRQFQYGFSADMEKMFRQIKLQEDDCHYQKVLWSRDLSSNFQTFFLTTVTYGLASAPFLANRVINQLACDEEHRFPEAAQILRKGTYALLLTQLSNRFINSLSLQSASIHLWTDSTVALAWIQAHPSRWKDFVRNRVVTIQETLPQAQWHHISGKENPADCASRGITAQQLTENSLWLYGPPWLRDDVSSWPSRIQIPIADPDSDLEEKIRVLSNVSVQICDGWELLQRYSSLPKLLRVTVMCFRAVLRFKRNLNHSSLTSIHSQELIQARLYWTQNVQKFYFHDDTTKIAQGLPLSKNNPLLRLSPFVDTFGILRIGGRLRNSLLDPDTKHPIILPKESYFTQLIIQDAHLRSLHGGTQTTLAYIRRSYWILGGRRPVRSFILKCVRCTRYRGEAAKQLMGQLPPARVIPTRPFLNSGIDYAGPFQFKTWRGRAAKQYKGYIALFICLATSAIHLEAVTDYTTEGFISAFKRFTGRRGICSTLSSDCGTNLIGADIQLRKLFSSSCAEINHLKTLLANDGTEWRFIPPSAPHFGGKWEAGVKSVKFHLKRVIGNMTLTFEEFTTLLCQIEAVVNSRPLCPISDDPDDIDALAPGHFLIGSSMTSLPEPSLVDVKMNKLTRWQLNRQMLEHFWNRW